jgi:hypothetical protein
LSAPYEDPDNPSLNELIDKEEFSLQYVSIDDAINIIKRLGIKSWLNKTDITDAFKVMPLLQGYGLTMVSNGKINFTFLTNWYLDADLVQKYLILCH